MNGEKKRYQVTIFGESYSLVSDEPEMHVVQAAAYIDNLMQEIERAGATDGKKIAILAALQVSSKLISCQEVIKLIDTDAHLLTQLVDQQLIKHAS